MVTQRLGDLRQQTFILQISTGSIYLGNRVDSEDLCKLQLDLDGERRLTFCFLIFL